MSTHASIWTPRHTHKLWPKPKQKYQIKATPYVAPPPPPPLKKPPPPDAVHASAEFLESIADELMSEATGLESLKAQPSVRLQLGLYLLEKDDAIKGVLKAWDTKNKGEFLRAEFRLNLRTTGIQASSAEADDLFDSWDDDKGGSLDLKELRKALLGVQEEARRHRATPDPNALKAQTLRKRAHIASEAARASAHAERLEDELASLVREQRGRADVCLGNILNKRRIKPGAVVTSWAKSRGAHSGELSKAEFREQVWALGLSATGCTLADVDKVFDTFDADGGGYMDAEEAAAMIKGLQATADEADHEHRRLERSARSMRARAAKKAHQAQEPVPDMEAPAAAPLPSPVSSPPPSTPTKKKKGKKKGDAAEGAADSAGAASSADGEGAPSAIPASPPEPSSPSSPSAIRKFDTALVGVKDALGGLLRDSERKRTESKKQKEAERVQANVLQRIAKALLWKGFHTWAENHDDLRRQRHFLQRAVMRMQQGPGVDRAFETWREEGEAFRAAKDAATYALRHWVAGAAVRALRSWEAETHARRRLAEKARHAQTFATRLKQPRVAMCLSVWKVLLTEPPPPRPPPLNPCVALKRSVDAAAACVGLQGRRVSWFCRECSDSGEPEDWPRTPRRRNP